MPRPCERGVLRAAALLLSMLAVGVLFAGCDFPEPTGPGSERGELVALPPTPRTVWELIDRLSAAPPTTLAQGQALVKGPMRWPLSRGRYESTGADLSTELRDVTLTIALSDTTEWERSAVDVTVDRCVTSNDVRQRYPRLSPAGIDTPRPDAERYLAQDEAWGTMSVAFRVRTGCLSGVSMYPPRQ